jgi:hypothetical protein
MASSVSAPAGPTSPIRAWRAGGALRGGEVAARLLPPLTARRQLNIWNRWDALWYIDCDGRYTYAPHAQTSVIFYRVLPLLLLILHFPFSFLPFNPIWSGVC